MDPTFCPILATSIEPVKEKRKTTTPVSWIQAGPLRKKWKMTPDLAYVTSPGVISDDTRAINAARRVQIAKAKSKVFRKKQSNRAARMAIKEDSFGGKSGKCLEDEESNFLDVYKNVGQGARLLVGRVPTKILKQECSLVKKLDLCSEDKETEFLKVYATFGKKEKKGSAPKKTLVRHILQVQNRVNRYKHNLLSLQKAMKQILVAAAADMEMVATVGENVDAVRHDGSHLNAVCNKEHGQEQNLVLYQKLRVLDPRTKQDATTAVASNTAVMEAKVADNVVVPTGGVNFEAVYYDKSHFNAVCNEKTKENSGFVGLCQNMSTEQENHNDSVFSCAAQEENAASTCDAVVHKVFNLNTTMLKIRLDGIIFGEITSKHLQTHKQIDPVADNIATTAIATSKETEFDPQMSEIKHGKWSDDELLMFYRICAAADPNEELLTQRVPTRTLKQTRTYCSKYRAKFRTRQEAKEAAARNAAAMEAELVGNTGVKVETVHDDESHLDAVCNEVHGQERNSVLCQKLEISDPSTEQDATTAATSTAAAMEAKVADNVIVPAVGVKVETVHDDERHLDVVCDAGQERNSVFRRKLGVVDPRTKQAATTAATSTAAAMEAKLAARQMPKPSLDDLEDPKTSESGSTTTSKVSTKDIDPQDVLIAQREVQAKQHHVDNRIALLVAQTAAISSDFQAACQVAVSICPSYDPTNQFWKRVSELEKRRAALDAEIEEFKNKTSHIVDAYMDALDRPYKKSKVATSDTV